MNEQVCNICGKKLFDVNFHVEVSTNHETLDCVCEDCAKDFCKRSEKEPFIEVTFHNNICHQCYFCEDVRIEPEMKHDEKGWVCEDCADCFVSRGEKF